MTVRERLLRIRLIDLVEKQPDYASRIGIEVLGPEYRIINRKGYVRASEEMEKHDET